MVSKTIVALATPPGSGGVAIIRISGQLSAGLLNGLHSRAKYAIAHPRELTLGNVSAGGAKLDQGLAVFMPGPKSYTGEDVAELHLHTGPAIIKHVLNEALQLGATLAEPGEFTKRAYLNGKLDLAQAEAVADIVVASSAKAASLARSQLAGKLSCAVTAMRANIILLCAELAANLDFGEEDIADVSPDYLLTSITRIRDELILWLSSSDTGLRLRQGLRVAIVGPPNAGKSSLLNALVGYDRAIVTSIAGTTRDIIEEQIEIEGVAIRLTDTAGLTETKDVVEGIGVERALLAADEADIILLAAHSGQSLANLNSAIFVGKQIVGIWTKSDEPGQEPNWPINVDLVVRTSVTSNPGVSQLRKTLGELATNDSSSLELPLLANLRHIQATKLALQNINSAHKAVQKGMPQDIIAGELSLAADALTAVLGERANQELLDSIFANFCIGK